MINLNLGTASRWGLNALILLGLVLALNLGKSIFIPTVIALLLAAMLWPSTVWLNRQGLGIPFVRLRPGLPFVVPCVRRLQLPWSAACATVVAMLVAIAFLVALGFTVAIPRVLQSLPNDPDKEQQLYSRFRDKIVRISPVPIDPTYLPERASESEAFKYIKGALSYNQPFVFDTLKGIAAFAGTYLWQSILIMFILLFLLLEGRMLTRRVVEIFGPSQEVRGKVLESLTDMAGQIRTYLVWRTIINFFMGFMLGFAYALLGLSQPWLWALFTAILWYVPYLGPILAGVPPVLDAFITCDQAWVAPCILAGYVVVVTVEGYLIVPLVMGRSMELNATTVMLACLFWELVWGTAGLFLAMPLMAAVRTICMHVPDGRPWANLMGTHVEPDSSTAIPEELLADTQLLSPAEMEDITTKEGWKISKSRVED